MSKGKDVSLVYLYKLFPDNAAAERWIEEIRWGKRADGLPEFIRCPHCGGGRDRIRECRNRKPMPYHCGACRKRFSVRIGTVLYRSRISYRNWAFGIWLYLSDPMGINAVQLSRKLEGVNYRSALFLLHRLREGWPDSEPLRSRFLEVDEAWVGGNDKKRHADKKFGRNWRKGRVQVLGGADRESGRAAAEVIFHADHGTVAPFVEDHLEENETLCTDEAPVYAALTWPGTHLVVNHQKGEYVRDEAHTNTIEAFWAKLKAVIFGTYRHVSPKYFPRYLKEIVGRYNIRGMALLDQMEFLVRGMLNKRLSYRDLLATEVPPTPFTHHRSGERASLFK